MLKYLCIGLSFFLPFEIYAFDPSCFREHAILESAAGVIALWVKDISDEPFFVSSGTLLPSRNDTTEKNPPLQYTNKEGINIIKLADTDPYTGIEVDPYDLAAHDVSYTFDLGKVYSRDTIVPTLGYYTHGKIKIEISIDGNQYIPVELSRSTNLDLRFFRVTFQRQPTIEDITFFHTLTFYQKIQSRYLVETPGWKIDIYTGYSCQKENYRNPLQEIPRLLSQNTPTETLSINFTDNPLYKNDTDGDGIENLRDNCPNTINTDQKDRNRDGIWDACADDDGDGIPGSSDNCPTVANADQADKNVNTIGDACEFDSDSDGIPDGVDNAIHVPNPDQKDRDNDRIGDIMDNCSLYNPDQLDLDKNGKWDVCDSDEAYRKVNDSDRDGVLDFSDNCPTLTNADQKDTDHDGIWDVCDNCLSLQNTDQEDTDKNRIGDACDDIDHDSIEGWKDNCPTVSNPDQKDANNDWVGNACSDTDRDGIFDDRDNCPTLYNPDQNDIDQDRIGDICDTHDDRFLESNKYIFMWLIWFFALLFIGGIVFLLRKMNTPQK